VPAVFFVEAVAHPHDERHGKGGGVNERYGIWRGIRWRLLMVVGSAAILGLIDLVGHLLLGSDLLALSSRESPLPTSQAFPLYLAVLAVAVAIGVGCVAAWRLLRRRKPPDRGWQPPR
jgi:hypothetical protein